MSDLPNHWVVAPLKDIVSKLVDGSHNPPPKMPQGLPMLSAINITNNQIEFSTFRLITPGSFAEENRRTKVAPGDVLLTIVGAIGRAAVVPAQTTPFTLQRSVAVLSPIIVEPRFLMFQLEAPRLSRYLNDNARGTAQKGVYLKTLGQMPIWLPPLREQHRIVAKIEELFSELDKGVESLNTAREQLKIYRQSVLKAAFEGKLTENWRAENADKLVAGAILLGQITQERERQYENDLTQWREAVRAAENSGHLKPRKPSKPTVPDKPNPQQISLMVGLPPSWTWTQLGNFSFVTKLAGFEYTKFVKYDDAGDLEVIKAENAGPNGFRETEFSRVQSDTVASLERSQVTGGELLMVFVGAGTGNVAAVPKGRSFFLGPNIGMMRITSDRVNPSYVELFLRSPHGRELTLSSVKAVAQPSLSMGTIRQIPIALPSPAEQAEIVHILKSKLEAAEVLDAEIDAGLGRAEALRQSILKRAFSGQLVAQDGSDEPASVLLERIRAKREESGASKRQNNKNGKKEAA